MPDGKRFSRTAKHAGQGGFIHTCSMRSMLPVTSHLRDTLNPYHSRELQGCVQKSYSQGRVVFHWPIKTKGAKISLFWLVNQKLFYPMGKISERIPNVINIHYKNRPIVHKERSNKCSTLYNSISSINSRVLLYVQYIYCYRKDVVYKKR